MDRYGPSRATVKPARLVDLRRANSFTVASSEKMTAAHAATRHQTRSLDATGAIDQWAAAPLNDLPLLTSRSVADDATGLPPTPTLPEPEVAEVPSREKDAPTRHAAIVASSVSRHTTMVSLSVTLGANAQRVACSLVGHSRPVDRATRLSPGGVVTPAVVVKTATASSPAGVRGDGSYGDDDSVVPAVSFHVPPGPDASPYDRHLNTRPATLAPSRSLPVLVQRSSMFASISRTTRPRQLLRHQLRAGSDPSAAADPRAVLPPLSPPRALESPASNAARFSHAVLQRASALPLSPVSAAAHRPHGVVEECTSNLSEPMEALTKYSRTRWRAVSDT